MVPTLTLDGAFNRVIWMPNWKDPPMPAIARAAMSNGLCSWNKSKPKILQQYKLALSSWLHDCIINRKCKLTFREEWHLPVTAECVSFWRPNFVLSQISLKSKYTQNISQKWLERCENECKKTWMSTIIWKKVSALVCARTVAAKWFILFYSSQDGSGCSQKVAYQQEGGSCQSSGRWRSIYLQPVVQVPL